MVLSFWDRAPRAKTLSLTGYKPLKAVVLKPESLIDITDLVNYVAIHPLCRTWSLRIARSQGSLALKATASAVCSV